MVTRTLVGGSHFPEPVWFGVMVAQSLEERDMSGDRVHEPVQVIA